MMTGTGTSLPVGGTSIQNTVAVVIDLLFRHPEPLARLCYAKTRSRVMRRLFQASIHDEDHPERPLIGSGNLLAADVCGP